MVLQKDATIECILKITHLSFETYGVLYINLFMLNLDICLTTRPTNDIIIHHRVHHLIMLKPKLNCLMYAWEVVPRCDNMLTTITFKPLKAITYDIVPMLAILQS